MPIGAGPVVGDRRHRRSATRIGTIAAILALSYSSEIRFAIIWIGRMTEALETPFRIEPCFFEDAVPRPLSDLTVEIHSAASELGRTLHPDSVAELAEFVRVMNCYYSNLIEGHDTRPKDIERALAGAEVDEARRPLALEARAHVQVQREIDGLHRAGALPSPTSAEFILWVHRRFYEAMPPEFRRADLPGGRTIEIVPGRFRTRNEEDVAVGRHHPPSSAVVSNFMAHFAKRFEMAEGWPSIRVIAIASAHHRLNFIHPFIDGNGRVSRLVSHAMALRAGIGGGGLWSVSRGLARGLRDRGEYKRMMDHADMPRQGSRDGRGNLSEAALRDFCNWFLSVVLDQIRFTSAAFRFDALAERYRRLLADLGHDARSGELISTVLRFGEIERGQAALVLQTSERTARTTVSRLVAEGFLKSRTPKSAVRVAFPLDYRDRLFPNLFADHWIEAPEPPAFRFGK
ncbi:Fic family protein [Methylorubrum thiocyanatum]|uniref:Fic family protein n=1 Tax=Methylorubrum thiocyanatum TaxID=47958 RepID=UPI0035C86DDC